VLLMGRLNGKIKGERYIDYAPKIKQPMMNLHMALLDKAGVPIDHIGDSTGMLTDI
jgi:hypothetical protein